MKVCDRTLIELVTPGFAVRHAPVVRHVIDCATRPGRLPMRCFFCGSFLFRVCSLQPCGHLLGKDWPLGSLVCDIFLCFCHFPMWCPGPGVVLDCIDTRYLPYSYFACKQAGSRPTFSRIMTWMGDSKQIMK